MRARDRISDGKYVVFKTDDFYQFCIKMWNGAGDNGETVEEIALSCNVVLDGTVIRAQDVFAAPALHAYANAIVVAMEVAHTAGIHELDAIERLQAVADYFHDAAAKAEHTEYKKIPD